MKCVISGYTYIITANYSFGSSTSLAKILVVTLPISTYAPAISSISKYIGLVFLSAYTYMVYKYMVYKLEWSSTQTISFVFICVTTIKVHRLIISNVIIKKINVVVIKYKFILVFSNLCKLTTFNLLFFHLHASETSSQYILKKNRNVSLKNYINPFSSFLSNT